MARGAPFLGLFAKACLIPGRTKPALSAVELVDSLGYTKAEQPRKPHVSKRCWEKPMMLTVAVSHPWKTAKGWGSLS